MIYHTRAGFKCLRETIGYSQRDVADIARVGLNSVKRWERPGESYEGYYDAPLDVWRALERTRERQAAFEEAFLCATEKACARRSGAAVEVLDVDAAGLCAHAMAFRREGDGALAVEVQCANSSEAYEEGVRAGALPALGSWLAQNASAGRIADELDGLGVTAYVTYFGRDDGYDRAACMARWAKGYGTLSRTPARLRLVRELIGRTQGELARAYDTTTARVKTWENVGNLPYREQTDGSAVKERGAEVWGRLLAERERQLTLEQMLEERARAGAAELAERHPGCDQMLITLPLFRSQMGFEECARALGAFGSLDEWRESATPSWWWLGCLDSYLVANAVLRHVADVLDGEGYTVLVYYGGLQEQDPEKGPFGFAHEDDLAGRPAGASAGWDAWASEEPVLDGLPEFIGCRDAADGMWYWLSPVPPAAWLAEHGIGG